MLKEVTKDSFDEEVLKSEKPVLVDFWAPTCAHCLALMPAVEEIAENYADKLKVVKMNIIGNRLFCVQNFKIMSLPAFIFFKEGREAKRLSGQQITTQELEKAAGELL